MKQKTPQIIIWAIAIILTARLTWTVAQHNTPVLITSTVALSVLFSAKQGAETLARGIAAARKNGSAR
ncbi:hypothetical protein ACGFZS_46850 [Streptomyces sp. NPDC048288]|uniref:hypothetical protein n=1 Tax=Streptomyces sp. NPDC048288 TaxID=3365529 RepID=UPI003722D5DA